MTRKHHGTHKSGSRNKKTFNLDTLENRELLTTAAWLGQNGADYVGPWAGLGSSKIQDIDIRLSQLPTDKTIIKAVVQGYGADRWEYGGQSGNWAADLHREAGSSSADIYIEPSRLEKGREFQVGLTFNDGSVEDIYFQGLTADPTLTVQGTSISAVWLGSVSNVDLTNPSPSVGPDGVTDLQIKLSQINTNKKIQTIDLRDSNNVLVASYGLNSARADTLELTPDPVNAGQATLTFSNPSESPAGPLTVQVNYTDGTHESATCNLGSLNTSPVNLGNLPTITQSSGVVQWNGQQVADPTRPGWEQITLTNLPETSFSAFQVSDLQGQSWLWTSSGQASPWATVYGQKSLVARATAGGDWVLEFDSTLDLNAKSLSVIGLSDTGRTYALDFQGGQMDLAKRAATPDAGSITAHPGDDLQALVNQYGTVNLSSGIYQLTQPLVLSRPVNLLGNSTSVLEFQQPATSAGWSTVVTVASGNVTLDGFQIRFSGTVNWRDNISYGPAVIGTLDNYVTGVARPGTITNVTIKNLNITAPQPSSYLQEAPRLIRMIDGASGTISGNTFYGGSVEVNGGSWSITNNVNNGVWQNSFAYDAFAAHNVKGFDLSNNVVNRSGNSGVIFRLVVVNGQSSSINIADNQAVGLGSGLNDPWQMQQTNANEVILTENYGVSYEGDIFAIDSTRRLVQVGSSLGSAYQPGDVLAVLDGTGAGTWVYVTSVINGNSLLLDRALPAGVQPGTAVSVNRGIHDISITGNLIDQTNRPQSLASVLVGNLYHVTYADNTIAGGFRGLLVTAVPSESPRDWGWTRNVVFDAQITGNTFEDVLWLNQLGVSHTTAARANYGHLYLTGSFQKNLFRWSASFLTDQIHQLPGDSNLFLPGLEVGEGGVADNHESRLTITENMIDLPAGWANRPAIWYRSGTINHQAAQGEIIVLNQVPTPVAPTGLALTIDSGISQTDSITNDTLLHMDSVAGLTYQYRVGDAGTWLNVPNVSGWRPMGVSEGLMTIHVRAINSFGHMSPESSVQFTLDTTPPEPVTGFVQPTFDTVAWQVSTSRDVVSQFVAFRNNSYWQSSNLSGSASSIAPDKWIVGTNYVDVSAMDVAGNRSTLATFSVQYATSGVWGGQDGSDYASLKRTLVPDGYQDIRLDIQGLPYGKTVTAVSVAAFGGGKWAWPFAPAGSNAAYWRLNANKRSGSVYFQTNRREIGRPFNVTIQYSDGTSTNFWVVGGNANPSLKVTASPTASQTRHPRTTNTATKPKATVKIPLRTSALHQRATARAIQMQAAKLRAGRLGR